MTDIVIPVADVAMGEDEVRAVADVVRGGRLSTGPAVAAFEESFAEYVSAEHAVAVNTGTAALHVALAALDIGPGDEVLLPSLTFIATVNAVLYQGAVPVLCECDPDTYNVRVKDLLARLTPRTRAVIVVDMNGMPVDYDAIAGFARDAGLALIADSAESLGATYRGRRIGGIAPIHTFSFFPNKIMTTGEGGMITTASASLARRLRRLLNQGQEGRYHHVELGYNYRMTEVQAALGRVQLGRVDARINAKNGIAETYRRAFAGSDLVHPPTVPSYVTQHSWYMYSVKVAPSIRDAVVARLAAAGIETRLSFPPVHTQPFIQRRLGCTDDELPQTVSAWSGKIDIPAWPGLSADQLETVARAVLDAAEACHRTVSARCRSAGPGVR